MTEAPEHAATLYLASTEVFENVLVRVTADQWQLPTPCTEWRVRDLVNHLTVEDLWTPHLLAGETMADVGDAYDGDQLGDDPQATWREAAGRSRAAVSEPGAAERTVHLSYGDDHASAYLMQAFTDHLIHSWDLAAAIGADRRLPDDLVAACAAWFADTEPLYREYGLLGPPVATSSHATEQDQLLARFGRDPAWSG